MSLTRKHTDDNTCRGEVVRNRKLQEKHSVQAYEYHLYFVFFFQQRNTKSYSRF